MTARPVGALLAIVVLAGSPASQSQPSLSTSALQAFQARAARFNAVIKVPAFETTPQSIDATLADTIAAGNRALDRIGSLQQTEMTFDNTVGALDEVRFESANATNRLGLIEQTSPNRALRDGATTALKALQEWIVGIDYREDVYRSIRRYAALNPELKGEAAKLLSETTRDYRRAGLDLTTGKRDEVERWRKDLETVSTDFRNNVTRASKAVVFPRAALEGVPEDFLQAARTGDDEYTVMVNVTYQYVLVMQTATREATRRRLEVERANLARDANVPLIARILSLRYRIAKALGYSSWADYATEVRMAGNARTAIEFLEKLNAALRPAVTAQLKEYRRLKIRDTGDPDAKINVWDWRYYSNLLKKEKYHVDAEQLRVYFPYRRVLDGMFAICERLFDLKFERVDAPYKWVDDLQFYTVSDGGTGEPLGLFYLDMFPRDGKYNHFATFGISDGRQLRDGTSQRPVVALVCNFPRPSAASPSLLSHREVETLFHEFGHALHAILTRARFSRFSGLNVPRDFVEAPSQMLEKWVRDRGALDSFAADYRDPSRKIPPDILAGVREAGLATDATRYASLFVAYGLMDLALHTRVDEANAQESVGIANAVVADVFLPWPDDTAFLAYFGHLVGYDGGYYGYAWADAIAADMATVFERAPDRYFDRQAGLKLRREIYEPGDSRDVSVSIERFLGRPVSLEPLLKQLGISGSAAGREMVSSHSAPHTRPRIGRVRPPGLTVFWSGR